MLAAALRSLRRRTPLSPARAPGELSLLTKHRPRDDPAVGDRLRMVGTEAKHGAVLGTDGRPAGLARNVWHQEELAPRFPKLETDAEADVVILGGGLAGLSVAYNLVKDGKSVVVLESRTCGSGQTGRTTAHLMVWNDDYYHNLESLFGAERTRLVADSHRRSIDWVEQVSQAEGIDCNFQRVTGYLIPDEPGSGGDQKDSSELDQELAAAQRAGLADAKRVDLGGDPRAGGARNALAFPGCADFQPLAFLRGLADAVARRGGRIFELSHAMATKGCEVSTKEGHTVRAGNVVLATNCPPHHNLAIHARQTPWRSYVVGLRMPKGGFMPDSQFWTTASPYHYVRLQTEEDGTDVLIVGGEDHPTGQKPHEYPTRADDEWSRLEAWGRGRWPEAGERLYEWSGQVYEPIDNLGLYGPDPLNDLQGSAKYYTITGDSGQGMTGGAIAGIVVADYILGRNNPWKEVYSPSRAPPAKLEPLSDFTHAVVLKTLWHPVRSYDKSTGHDTWILLCLIMKSITDNHDGRPLPLVGKTLVQSFANRVLPGWPHDIEDIKPGCGAVVQAGLHKVAVYRDPDGKEHTFSAGALVQWNPNEGTFDCPLHGSHFDRHGRLIQGPAKADLPPMEIGMLGAKPAS